MISTTEAGLAAISFEEVKAGNTKAWADMCEHFKIGLLAKANQLLLRNRIARKVGSEDIVQETYLKAWLRRETFHGSTFAEFSGWLLCMLKSTFLDICRKKNLECTIHSWFDCSSDEDSPSKMAVSSESESALYCALGDIDECSQKVIGMRHFEQLKFAEIAERLEMKPSSVASIYRRGIQKLHKAMSDYQSA